MTGLHDYILQLAPLGCASCPMPPNTGQTPRVCAYAQEFKVTGSGEDDSDGDGSSGDVDCEPCNAEIHPNAAFSYRPVKNGSFDRNCSGAEEKQLTTIGACVASGMQCVKVDGWSKAVPACGQTGAVLDYCNTNNFGSYVVCGAQYTLSNAHTQNCRSTSSPNLPLGL